MDTISKPIRINQPAHEGVATAPLPRTGRGQTRLDLVARVSRAVIGSVSVGEQLQAIARQVCEAFSVDACVIRALEGESITLMASVGVPREMLPQTLPAQLGVMADVLGQKSPVAIEDVADHPATAHLDSRRRENVFQFRSYAGAPLLFTDASGIVQVTGILGVYTRRDSPPRQFSPKDLEYLQIVANHVAVAVENDRLYQQVSRQNAEREQLLRAALDRAERDPLTGLLNHYTFYERLHQAAEKLSGKAAPHGCAIALFDVDHFKFFNEAYGHIVGDAVLRRIADVLRAECRHGEVAARMGGDEFALLVPGLTRADLPRWKERIHRAVRRAGYTPPGGKVEIPLRLSLGVALLPEEAPTVAEAVALADERLREAKRTETAISATERTDLQSRVQNFALLDALVGAVDNKDRYTRRHSEQVLRGVLKAGAQMGLSPNQIETLRIAALLHDVGKIGVPDAVLSSPTVLSESEYKAMQQHPLLGALLVSILPNSDELVAIVKHHHEHWNGEGYPDGLQGETIPFLARVLAVADAYSAMTCDRPYRKGYTYDEALHVLRNGAGVQWDKTCVQAFIAAFSETDTNAISPRFPELFP